MHAGVCRKVFPFAVMVMVMAMAMGGVVTGFVIIITTTTTTTTSSMSKRSRSFPFVEKDGVDINGNYFIKNNNHNNNNHNNNNKKNKNSVQAVSSSSLLSSSSSSSSSLDDFHRWADENGIIRSVKIVMEKDMGGGKGLVATRDLRPGEMALQVPRKLAIRAPSPTSARTTRRRHHRHHHHHNDHDHWAGRLASQLLHHQQKQEQTTETSGAEIMSMEIPLTFDWGGADDHHDDDDHHVDGGRSRNGGGGSGGGYTYTWKPFTYRPYLLGGLPTDGPYTPSRWTSEELLQLQNETLSDMAIEAASWVETQYRQQQQEQQQERRKQQSTSSSSSSSISQPPPSSSSSSSPPSFTKEQFQAALSLVCSRAMETAMPTTTTTAAPAGGDQGGNGDGRNKSGRTKDDSHKRDMILVPFMDSANHATNDGGGGQYVVGSHSVMLFVGKNGARKDQPVTLNYGEDRTVDEYLLHYGFVPDPCPGDSVQVPLVTTTTTTKTSTTTRAKNHHPRRHDVLLFDTPNDDASVVVDVVVVSWKDLRDMMEHPDPAVRQSCRDMLLSYPTTLEEDERELDRYYYYCRGGGDNDKNDYDDDDSSFFPNDHVQEQARILALQYRCAKKRLLMCAAGEGDRKKGWDGVRQGWREQ